MSLIKHQNRKKMKTQNNNTTTKRAYQAPKVEQVKLDNEISMVMMSFTAPPGDPNTMPTQDPLMSLKVFRLFK
jgi:hypothetical protein